MSKARVEIEPVFEILITCKGKIERTGQILREQEVAPYVGSFNSLSHRTGRTATVEPLRLSRVAVAR